MKGCKNMLSKEEMKVEAVERMKLFGIFPETIKQFEEDDLISESAPPLGACYWVNEEQLKRVQKFEETFGGLVYHVIHSYTDIGEMECYLYVCKHKEEWVVDREGIENGEILAYVNNLDAPDCSELGYIGVELSPAAGLTRVW